DGRSERDGRSGGTDGYGWVVVERSGGIGGMLMAWELDIDSSTDRDELGRQVAELPWSQAEKDANGSATAHTDGGSGADRTDVGGGTGGAGRLQGPIEGRDGRVP